MSKIGILNLQGCKTVNTKIKIKCIVHNIIFEIIPRSHLISETCSCPQCKIINIKNIKQIDSSHFIEKSKKLFGDKFNYSKVNYINKKEDIILINNKLKNKINYYKDKHFYKSMSVYT